MGSPAPPPSGRGLRWLAWRLRTPLTEAPNGGWGWVVTAASFTVHVVILGLAYSFGVLNKALLDDDSLPGSDDRAAVSLVGSISVAFMLAMGVVTGSLVHRYGARWVTLVGSAIVTAGLVAASYAPTVPLLYPSYGLLLGAGYSLTFSPSVMIVPTMFTTRRSLAVGLAVAGSGAGTFIFSSLNGALIEAAGWRVTLRVDAVLAAVFVTAAGLMYVPVVEGRDPHEQQQQEQEQGEQVERTTSSAAAANAGGKGAAATPASSDSASAAAPPPRGMLRRDDTIGLADSGAGAEVDDRRFVIDEPSAPQEGTPEPGATAAGAPLGGTRVESSAGLVANASVFVADGAPTTATGGDGSAAAPRPPLQRSATQAARAALPYAAPLTRMQVFRSRPFLQVAAAITLFAGGLFVVYTHLATFVVEEAGQSHAVGARIVSAIGVGNICGRIVLGRVADVVSAATPRGKVYLFGGSMAVSGGIVMLLGVPGLGTSLYYLVPFAFLFGFSSGGLVSLTPPILVDALGLDALPLALGGTYSAQAATVLLFPPLGGWVRTATGSYAADWGWAGAVMLAAGPTLWAFPARPDDWYTGPRKLPPPAAAAGAGDSVVVPVEVGSGAEAGAAPDVDGKGG